MDTRFEREALLIGEASVENLSKARVCLFGVGGVGKVGAKALAKRFKNIENLQNATKEELVELEDVGEITADGIVAYFQDEENIAELNRLKELGINPKEEEKTVVEGIFQGQFVVLTGTLVGYKRSEAQKIIENEGGECQSSVTAKTTLVLAGESAGSKLDKAKKLGVKIISEEEFNQMLGKA